MQIITLDKYDWGHLLPAIEKKTIADAVQDCQKNILTPKAPQSELIIVETIEDLLE
jgi:hypothetical protein